jgi:5-methylthioadenosine/S-adenosylhomocysteine deaminase
MLLPGLVNAHTHAAMNVFRNSADDLLFNDWLFGRVMPMEDKLCGEDCYWGTQLACLEMIATGTTSFIDMYYFTDDVTRAVDESGMRAVMSRGLSGDKSDPATAEAKLREAVDVYEKWKGHPRITFMLAPHAPYTCDDGYMTEVGKTAKELGLGLHVHLSESLSEMDTIREGYGCTPIELADRCGILTDRTVAAHCIQLSDSDIALIAARGTTVATNPVSNLKLGNGVAPVPKLLEAGVNVALGTDGAASNNALNLFRELSFVALLHKGLSGDTTAVPAAEALRMATVNGAGALGLSGCGEVKAGNRADLTVLDIDKPWLRPHNDLLSSLVYCARGDEVEDVMVDGRFLLRKRELQTIDRERVLFEVDKTCRRLGILK